MIYNRRGQSNPGLMDFSENSSPMKVLINIKFQARRITSDIENLHMTTSRQRDLLEVKDRQSIESDERERKTNLLIHSAQQLFKAEKDEVLRDIRINKFIVGSRGVVVLLL